MKSASRGLLFCSAKNGARIYACMPSGYCDPSVLSSSTETRVVIGYLTKNRGSTASACFTKLISSAAKRLEETRTGLAAWMDVMGESPHRVVGNGTDQVHA